jgi:hypothetical protein
MRPAHAIAQRLAKMVDVRSNNPLDDGDAAPDRRHEVVLADDPASLIHELDQDVEGASTDLHGLAIPLKEPRRGKEPEGPEGGDAVRALLDALARSNGHGPSLFGCSPSSRVS